MPSTRRPNGYHRVDSSNWTKSGVRLFSHGWGFRQWVSLRNSRATRRDDTPGGHLHHPCSPGIKSGCHTQASVNNGSLRCGNNNGGRRQGGIVRAVATMGAEGYAG